MTSIRKSHPAVHHPVALRLKNDLHKYEHGWFGRINQINDWLATHLGLVFGSVWVVWLFFIWPLIAQYMGSDIENKTSYYAQSWVQLFALALFVYIGNKLQRSSDAQSESMHQALTHVAIVSDQNKELIEQNTELTKSIEELTRQVHALVSSRSQNGQISEQQQQVPSG